MTGGEILQLVGSLGGAGVVAAVVNAIINRRRMGADVSDVIQKAAGGIVERIEGDNARLRVEISELKLERSAKDDEHRAENDLLWRKARATEQENAILIDALRDQVAHSRRQSEEIRRLGGHVEDPPALPAALLG